MNEALTVTTRKKRISCFPLQHPLLPPLFPPRDVGEMSTKEKKKNLLKRLHRRQHGRQMSDWDADRTGFVLVGGETGSRRPDGVAPAAARREFCRRYRCQVCSDAKGGRAVSDRRGGTVAS